MSDNAPVEPLQIAISISLPEKLRDAIDGRCTQLHLPRSRYLCLLAQDDIRRGGPLTLTPLSDQTRFEDFLDEAIPLLEEYVRDAATAITLAEFLKTRRIESAEDRSLWELFFAARKPILESKWIESYNAKRDIGWTAALLMWIKPHRPDWVMQYHQKHPPTG
jgi:hypothetical protein